MKYKTLQFLFLGISGICYFISIIFWAICFFAYSPERGIYAFDAGTPKFEIILSILYLIFLTASFPMFVFGLLRKNRGLEISAYFVSAIGYGIGLAVAITLHNHYNWGVNDPYFISVIDIVFVSIGLLAVLIMLIISLVQKLYLIKRNVINAAINESRTDNPTELLRKYKQLLDDGIINEEEYKVQKKKILGE